MNSCSLSSAAPVPAASAAVSASAAAVELLPLLQPASASLFGDPGALALLLLHRAYYAALAMAALWLALLAAVVAVLAASWLGVFGAEATAALSDTLKFWYAMYFYGFKKGSYSKLPFYNGSSPSDTRIRVHLFSLALVFRLWHKPHYRAGTFQQDMAKNLRNVALPGTGVALSWFCHSSLLFAPALVFGAPLVALVYALYLSTDRSFAGILRKYRDYLLKPDAWFFYWRLNCRLASYHALLTKTPGYRQEDKFTFLVEAQEAGIPISPFLDFPTLVAKDRNEEGGMGIHFFGNAVHGGRWILQPALSNEGRIAAWLPKNAPLSTMRVVTASDNALDLARTGAMVKDPLERLRRVKSLSCVFRAGLAGASTDHRSILFDVDKDTGVIGRGTTNAHWYKLGWHPHIGRFQPAPDMDTHPDSRVKFTGLQFDDMKEIHELVQRAHAELMPDVPLAGWDVAMTKEVGRCLLEVNLSCNFFNGTFDRPAYFKMLDGYLEALDYYEHQGKHLAKLEEESSRGRSWSHSSAGLHAEGGRARTASHSSTSGAAVTPSTPVTPVTPTTPVTPSPLKHEIKQVWPANGSAGAVAGNGSALAHGGVGNGSVAQHGVDGVGQGGNGIKDAVSKEKDKDL